MLSTLQQRKNWTLQGYRHQDSSWQDIRSICHPTWRAARKYHWDMHQLKTLSFTNYLYFWHYLLSLIYIFDIILYQLFICWTLSYTNYQLFKRLMQYALKLLTIKLTKWMLHDHCIYTNWVWKRNRKLYFGQLTK